MRRPVSSIRGQRHRNLTDPHLKQSSLHNHLAGELHPGCLQLHFENGVLAKPAKSAMKITAWACEKESSYSAKDRIAKISVQGGQGPGLDPALKAVSHNQVIALAEFSNKWPDGTEVIAVISVTHDYEFSARIGNPSHEGATISFGRNMDNARSQLLSYGLRSVCTTIVSNDDFPWDFVLTQCSQGFLDARCKRICLVQAGHHDGHFWKTFFICRCLNRHSCSSTRGLPRDCQ